LINNFIYSRKFENNFFLIITDIFVFSIFFSNSINSTDNFFFNNNITISISGKSIIFNSDLNIDIKNINSDCNSVFYKIFDIDTDW